MATTFNHYIEEQKIVESLVHSGLVEEILEQQVGEWSEVLTADQLFEELGLGSNV